MKTKWKHSGKRNARTVLLSALVVSILAGAGVFFGVNAADDVSPSDSSPYGQNAVFVSALSDSVSATDDDSAVEGTGEVTRTTPDFIASAHGKQSRFVRNRFVDSATYDGSYRSELTTEEQMIYDGYVENYVTNQRNQPFTVEFDGSVTFDGSSYDAEKKELGDSTALEDVYDMVISASAAFYYDHPEVFWIRSFDYSIGYYVSDGTGYLIDIEITSRAAYANAYNDLSTVQSGIQSAVSSIKSARASASRYDTVKAIHDYVCQNASYDNTSAKSSSYYTYGYAYTASPLFTSKKTFVCEGYSKSFKILCNEFGIPCILVSGTGISSTSGAHMWNYVQMEDGAWYGMDVTWDDSLGSYDYFLVGSGTQVTKQRTFGQDHLPTVQIMTVDTNFPLAYPYLSTSAYDPDRGNPADISLTTLGASVRISKPYGIRFGVQIAKDKNYRAANIVEYGTLIIGAGTLGSDELTLDTPTVRRIKAANVYSEDSSQLTYTGVLINIPKTFFGTDVKGRGYLIYKDSTGEHVIYSNTETKSFYGVAEAAYNNYAKISNPNKTQQATKALLADILANR